MENLINIFWKLLQLGFLIIAVGFVFLGVLGMVTGIIRGVKNKIK